MRFVFFSFFLFSFFFSLLTVHDSSWPPWLSLNQSTVRAGNMLSLYVCMYSTNGSDLRATP